MKCVKNERLDESPTCWQAAAVAEDGAARGRLVLLASVALQPPLPHAPILGRIPLASHPPFARPLSKFARLLFCRASRSLR